MWGEQYLCFHPTEETDVQSVTELAFKHTAGWDLALNSRFGWPWISIFQQPPQRNVLTAPTPSPKASPHKGHKGRHLYFSPAALTPEAPIHHLWEVIDIRKVTVTNLRYRHTSLLCLKPPTETLLSYNQTGKGTCALLPTQLTLLPLFLSVSLNPISVGTVASYALYSSYIHACPWPQAHGAYCHFCLGRMQILTLCLAIQIAYSLALYLPGSTLRNIISGRMGKLSVP